jgi:hypothetical protein
MPASAARSSATSRSRTRGNSAGPFRASHTRAGEGFCHQRSIGLAPRRLTEVLCTGDAGAGSEGWAPGSGAEAFACATGQKLFVATCLPSRFEKGS